MVSVFDAARSCAPQHLKTAYSGALHLEKTWANLPLQTFRGAAAGARKVSPFWKGETFFGKPLTQSGLLPPKPVSVRQLADLIAFKEKNLFNHPKFRIKNLPFHQPGLSHHNFTRCFSDSTGHHPGIRVPCPR